MRKIFIETDSYDRITGWGTSPISDKCFEIEIEENHQFFTDNPFLYIYKDGVLTKSYDIELENAKKNKDIELNMACKKSILGGFKHVISGVEYHFSYDAEAQINFGDARTAFDSGLIDEVNWTVKKDGEYTRIKINKEIMDELSIAILQHKNDNISKYRDVLLPMVEKAETVEEVESITWDSVSLDSIEN